MADARFSMSVEPCSIVQAESWPGTLSAFEAELSRQLGGKLPATSHETVAIGEWHAVRIAPRRFWFITDAGAQLRASIDPELGCLLPLGESRMRLRLAGPHTFDILRACVAVDWHSPDAAPGRAVQTGFHHVPVVLLRTAADACDVLAPRSFARSLADWVEEVAAPYKARASHMVTA